MNNGMPDARTPQVYRFADCELDVLRRELRRGGEPVAVQHKVFELLVYLIKNRDRAVDKDEIQSAIWPRVIVTETSLTQVIRKARRAVGDDSDSQSIIKTIHGHGYRFAADLIEVAADEPAPSALAADTRGRLRQMLGRPVVVVAALAIIATGVASAWLLLRSPAAGASAVRVAVLPVENATGDPTLDWTRLGLMSLASNRIASANVHVVADSDVLRLADAGADKDRAEVAGEDWLVDVLRRAQGATHLLSVRLEKEGDTLRLRHSLMDDDGHTDQGFVVGTDPMALTRGVADTVAARLGKRSARIGRGAALTDDSFVNEAYARGRALALEGRCKDAQEVLQAAINQAPTLPDPRFEFAVCARVLGDRPKAEELLRQLAAEQTGGAPTLARARVLNELGVVLSRTGRLDEAQAVLGDALPIAQELGDEELEADLLVNLAIIAEDRSRYDEAREYVGRALGALADAGRELIPGKLHAELANIAFDDGALDEADRQYALAVESFRAVGDRRREAMMLNNQGLLRREQGRLDEAETLHRASGAIREQLGDRQGVGRVHDMLAMVNNDRGKFDEAIVSATSALQIAREANDRFYEAVTLSHLADAKLGLRRFDEAEADFRQVRAIFGELGDQMRELQSRLKLAQIAMERGQLDAAQAAASEVLGAARDAKIDAAEIDALELLGDVAVTRGNAAGWEHNYTAALDQARRLGQSGDVARISAKLAGAYVDTGQVARAEPLIGYLSGAPESFDLLKVRAAYAFARGESANALATMQRARDLAGQRWTRADETQLAAYRNSRAPAP